MTSGNEYGRALFMLCCEEGTVDTVMDEIGIVDKAFRDNPEYVKLLDTPAVSKEEKHSLIDEAFKDLSYCVVNVIKLLSDRRISRLFSAVFAEYGRLYDEMRGIEHVEAVTAITMSDAQKRRLTEKLEGITGKTVKLKYTVDPSILGGVMLRYSGTQLDGSVKTRLESFASGLKNINL